jgi:hypothetical protein
MLHVSPEDPLAGGAFVEIHGLWVSKNGQVLAMARQTFCKHCNTCHHLECVLAAYTKSRGILMYHLMVWQ